MLAGRLFPLCEFVDRGYFEFVTGVSITEAAITDPLTPLTPTNVEIIHDISAAGPLEAVNPRPYLDDAQLVIDDYQTRGSVEGTGLWGVLPIFQALVLITVFMATFGQVAMAATQGGLKEDENDEGNNSLALQLSSAVVGVFTCCGMVQLAKTETLYRTVFLYLLYFLLVVLALIDTVEYLNGFGLPDGGHDFRDGANKFSEDIYGLLAGASPLPDSWSGDAARDYEKKNGYQESRVGQNFAEADRDLAGIIADQAAQVEFLRQGLAGAKVAIEGLFIFVVDIQNFLSYLNFTPNFIIDFVTRWVSRVSAGALLAALGLVVDTVSKGFYDFAPRINKIKQAYLDVAQDASVVASMPCPPRAAPVGRPAAAARSWAAEQSAVASGKAGLARGKKLAAGELPQATSGRNTVPAGVQPKMKASKTPIHGG